jgi:hypothetical protein
MQMSQAGSWPIASGKLSGSPDAMILFLCFTSRKVSKSGTISSGTGLSDPPPLGPRSPLSHNSVRSALARLPLKPDFAASAGKKPGCCFAFVRATFVFPACESGIVSHPGQLREFGVALTRLATVIAVGDNPISSADQKAVHGSVPAGSVWIAFGHCVPSVRDLHSYRHGTISAIAHGENSVSVVLVRLESVLSSVTLWTTDRNPLGALAKFQVPVPETPNLLDTVPETPNMRGWYLKPRIRMNI